MIVKVSSLNLFSFLLESEKISVVLNYRNLNETIVLFNNLEMYTGCVKY